MLDDTNEKISQTSSDLNDKELVDDLILQNQTINALIKGLEEDLETFKKAKEGEWTPQDTMRFTMQLNILHDKKKRNLNAINDIIRENKEII